MARKSKNYSTCHIVTKSGDQTFLDSFATKGKAFSLVKGFEAGADDAFPKVKFDKTWRDSFSPQLNVGLLPSSSVFFRVIELPTVELGEIDEMLELQMERLSPLPPSQVFWSYEIIQNVPGADEDQATTTTVLVIIAEQKEVYRFVSDLESRNFYADRVSIDNLGNFLHPPDRSDLLRLISTNRGDYFQILVQWWIGGKLQNVSQVVTTSHDKLVIQVEQEVRQTFWSGQMEGWVDEMPPVEIQCQTEDQAKWSQVKDNLGLENIEFSEVVESGAVKSDLARAFGKGVVQSDLMPEDTRAAHASRQFDSLWMTGLVCLALLYLVGVGVYFIFLNQAHSQRTEVKDKIQLISGSYTNALKIEERIRVTENQLQLRYAALDAWKSVVESLPPELSFKQFKFSKGETLLLNGQGPDRANAQVDIYVDALTALAREDGSKFFKSVQRKNISNTRGVMSWTIECQFPD